MITYTITVTNSGNVTVSDITVTDPLTGLEESVGTLAPNASTSVTTTHTITEDDILAGSFMNTATAKGTDPNGGEVSGNDDETVTTVEQAPALTVEKTANKAIGAALGEEISYAIKVTNSGNVTVSDITVSDPKTKLNETIESLAPGESKEYTTTHTITAEDIEAGSFMNTATAAGTDPNGGEVTGSDDETVTTVEAAPAWTVTKTVSGATGADGKAVVGDKLIYTVTVKNTGNTNLKDLKLEDEFKVDDVVNNEALTWTEGNPAETFGLTPSGTKEFTATYTVQATDNNLSNTAEVNGKSSTPVMTFVADKDAWTVEKTVSDATGEGGAAKVGDALTYTVTVKNTGNTDLFNLKLEDSFSVDEVVKNDALTWAEGSDPAQAFNLAQGAAKTFTATYTVQASDNSLSNTAKVGGETATIPTTVEGKDAWTVEKSVEGATGEGGAAKVGDTLTYTVTVKNAGNTDLSDLTLTDEFSVDGVVNNGALTWTEGSPAERFGLLQGATKNFKATYTVQATDNNLSNTAKVGDETDTETTEVEGKDAWTVEKSVEGATGEGGAAKVGDTLTYTVTVKNAGNTDLSDLTLTDEFSVDEVVKNDALTWTEGSPAEAFDLAQGATKNFKATYMVQASDNDLSNTAKVGVESDNETTAVEGEDAWTVEKTVSGANGADDKAVVGDELTYTVTVKNTGNTDLSNLTLTDEFSVDEVVKNDALTWTEGNPTQAFDLAQGATKTFTAAYTVQATDKNLSNTATVGKETTTIPTEVEDKPGLTVEKTADKASGAALGEEISYTITVTNSGNVTVSDITVEDPKTSLEESVGTLAPNASTSVTTTHTITEEDILAGSFVNTATATGTDPKGGEVTKSDEETVTTVAQAPALTVEKTADKTSGAALGEEISYTITVTNSGNVTVSGITVTDPKTGLNQSVGTLAPNASTSVATTHTITEEDILAGSFVNTVTATGTDPNGGEATKSDDETVSTVEQAPALTVVKTADKTSGAALGEEITYTITVTNSGNVTVSDITVTDPKTGLNQSVGTLAPGEDASVTTKHTITEADILAGSFVNTATATGTDPNSGEVTGSDDETVTPVAAAPELKVETSANKYDHEDLGETIIYTITVKNTGNVTVSDITVTDPLTGLEKSIGTLAPGEDAEPITTTYIVTEGNIIDGKVENIATATGTDPNGVKVTGSGPATVRTVDAAPALTVEKSADKASGANLNDVITYTIKVTNSGNETVNDITVTDLLTGLEKSAGTLAPGESTSVTTKHTITETDILAGRFVNTATATGTDPKGGEVTDSGSATVTTAGKKAVLTVVKTASKTEDAALGEEITYTITVTNEGNVTVSGITVNDPKTGLEESAGTLAPKESTSVTTTHKITEADILAGSFVNTATATGTDPDGEEVTGSDDETVTTAEQAPALTVEKKANKTSSAAPNDEITYTIKVTNSGNVTVSDITVTDPKTGLNQSAGTLAPGASASVTTTHTITEADILAGSFVNTATAAGTDPNGEEVTGSDDETVTTVKAVPELTVEKTTDKASGAALGEEITYTITVTNSGNETVSGITVIDELTGLEQGVGTLAPGASAEAITTTYTVQERDILAGRIENTATATGKDPKGSEVTGSDDETVTTVAQNSALSVEKTADKTSDAALNDVITYTIKVTNSGNVTVSGVTVTDPKTGLEESVGTLAPGEDASVTTTHTITAADIGVGSFANTATAKGTDPNGSEVTGSDDETVTTVAAAPALTVEKTADKTTGAALGEEITYTITVTNSGNVTVKDITVTDEKTGLNGTIESLAPGADAVTFTTTHTIAEADILAGSFVNTATATGKAPNGGEVTGSDDETVTTVAQAPALTVEKSADKTTGAALGEEITYTIKVTNSGNVTVKDITVTDPKTGLNESIESLAPGADPVIYTTKHTISEADILAGSFMNTATAAGTDPKGGEVTGSDDETVTTVAQAPALTVEKSADKTTGVALGEEISYAIKVTNSGNVTVSGITVTDPLTGLNEAIDSLAPKASKEYTTTHTISEADILAGSFVNTATATGKAPNGGEVTNSGSETVTTAAQNPALTVEKSADKTTGAALGEEITYTITVTNSGNVTVSGITVTDPKTGLEESVGALAPGKDASAITTHTITEADILAGSFENTATATGAGPKGGEVTGSGSATVTTVKAAPELTVEKTADKTSGVALGEEITYTIKVTNSGNETLSGITVTDKLTGLEQSIGALAPGASAEAISTTYTVQEADILAGEIVNTVTAAGTDSKGGKVTGSDDETVTTAAQTPALKVEKVADGTGHVGLKGEITYEIKVTNSGNVSVNNITVTDLKTGMNERIASLAPGAHEAFTTIYTVQEVDILAGQIENTAIATGTAANGQPVTGSGTETITHASGEPDPDEPDEPDKPVIDAPRAELTVKESVDVTGVVGLKDKIKYTITVTNTGNVSVYNVVVTDNGNVSTYSIAAIGNGPRLNEMIECLAPGEEWVYTMTYEVTEADILVGEIVETTTARGTDLNGNPVTGSDTVTLADEPNPTDPDEPVIAHQKGELAVAETVTSTPANGVTYALGENITFSITVKNAGNVTLSDVTVTDSLTGLNETVASLAPDAEQTFATVHPVTEADILAGAIENSATGSGTAPDGTTAAGEDSVSVNAIAPENGHLTIRKKTTSKPANGVTYALGEIIKYSITATNDGNLTLTGVVVSDALTGNTGENAWTIESLAPGASKTFTAKYKVTEADIKAGRFVNTATAVGTDPNGGEVANSGTATVTTATGANSGGTKAQTEIRTPGLAVTMAAPAGPFGAGDAIPYTITASNTGNVTMTGVIVSDLLTGLTKYVGTMAPGASATVTANYTVTAADAAAGSVTNTATVTGSDPDGNPVTQSCNTVTATARQRVTLTVNYWYDAVGGAMAAPAFSATYFAGAAYRVASPIVAGYAPSRVTVAGTITRNAVLDVIYTATPYTLTVNYVYEDGTVAAAAYTDALTIGNSYSVTSPVIAGYTASDAVVAGAMPGRNVTVTVIYLSEAAILPIDKHGISLDIGHVTMNVGECFE